MTQQQNNQELIEKLGCTDEEKTYVIHAEGTEAGVVLSESDEGCEVESCRGTVMFVEWAEGDTTECCTHGMKSLSDNVYQIL